MVTVQDLLLAAFQRFRNRPCLLWEGGFASYEETGRRAVNLAHWAQQNTPEQGHIGILLGNRREHLEATLGVAAAGRASVFLSPNDPPDELAYKMNLASLAALITDSDSLDNLQFDGGGDLAVLLVDKPGGGRLCFEEVVTSLGADPSDLVRCDSSHRCRFSFTGGTTGLPKGIVRNHQQQLATIRDLLLEVIEPGLGRVFVAATPLTHAASAFLLPTLFSGGSFSWTPQFDPDRLLSSAWLPGQPAIQTFLVPTALADVASGAHDNHALETIVYGGAPCPRPVLEMAVSRLGQCLVQVYGQAEAPMTISLLAKEAHADLNQIAGSAGVPFKFVDVRIMRDGHQLSDGDVGEVIVRGDHVMTGYWQNPSATAEVLDEDGSLHTQDLAYMDSESRLWIVGRLREMIISGGFNVYLDEVERRLGRIEGAQQITIFGAPDTRWGETVVAAVVVAPGVSEVDVQAALANAVRTRLAPYERPKATMVLKEIPLTKIGKVSRKSLTEQYLTWQRQAVRETKH